MRKDEKYRKNVDLGFDKERRPSDFGLPPEQTIIVNSQRLNQSELGDDKIPTESARKK